MLYIDSIFLGDATEAGHFILARSFFKQNRIEYGFILIASSIIIGQTTYIHPMKDKQASLTHHTFHKNLFYFHLSFSMFTLMYFQQSQVNTEKSQLGSTCPTPHSAPSPSNTGRQKVNQHANPTEQKICFPQCQFSLLQLKQQKKTSRR